MKKIPTLYKRIYDDHKIIGITDEFTDDICWHALMYGIATIKYDGSACAIISGELYKRYDCKKGKKPPEGAIPCCDPDPITGHWPHWVKTDANKSEDKWFIEAFEHAKQTGVDLSHTSYEAIGYHFNGNPYGLTYDTLVPHGQDIVSGFPYDKLNLEGLREFLERNLIEGIVFWLDNEPVCKIKRTDFGLKWPI